MNLLPFDETHHADAIRIWNAACHPHHPLHPRLLAYNTIPCTGETIEGRVAVLQGEAVGFVLACSFPADPLGWISALAVHPAAQRQGAGTALLQWAETWLRDQGCSRIRLGGNVRPFLPGPPAGMPDSLAFFEPRGYQSPASQRYEYDIARSLKDYRAVTSPPAHARLAPMLPGEEPRLLEFLQREFPGRWLFEAEEFLRNQGRPADFLLLWVEGEVHGFCRLTLEDSERPIERFYPQRLGHPWGQFGPLGVSRAVRGQGLGGYLVDAAALHLQALGVDGCIIDWTSLVDFYGKFGFTEYSRYVNFFKRNPPEAS